MHHNSTHNSSENIASFLEEVANTITLGELIVVKIFKKNHQRKTKHTFQDSSALPPLEAL